MAPDGVEQAAALGGGSLAIAADAAVLKARVNAQPSMPAAVPDVIASAIAAIASPSAPSAIRRAMAPAEPARQDPGPGELTMTKIGRGGDTEGDGQREGGEDRHDQIGGGVQVV